MHDLLHGFGLGWMPAVAAGIAVNGLWQGAVLALATWMLLRMMPGTTAALRFVVWSAVFAVVVALPFLGVFAGEGQQGGLRGAVRLDVRWSYAIAAIWMAVSAVRLVGLVADVVRLRGIWRRAVPVVGCDLASVPGVTVCASEDVDRPCVIGFFSPRVLLPPELLERLTAAELEQIVLHEAAHLRRRDDWINLLQKIGLVLVPLNPALLWVDRRMCLERELACDDGVLERTGAPKAYARCLTNLAETRLARRMAALSLGAWERQSELTRRVHSILGGGTRMGRRQARAVAGMVLVTVMAGSVELARCPQVVSFASAPVGLAQGSGAMAGYQPVAFRGEAYAPHETLLKASMPVDVGVRSAKIAGVGRKNVKRKSAVPAVVRTVREVPAKRRQARGVLVLSSWDVPARPMVLTVIDERVMSGSYAAVATDGGWFVFQL